jgi:hypothetical protein
MGLTAFRSKRQLSVHILRFTLTSGIVFYTHSVTPYSYSLPISYAPQATLVPLAQTTAKGVIWGHVVTADTSRILRGARVEAATTEGSVRTTITDDYGVYRFSDLPFGRYTIRATKNGYITDWVSSNRVRSGVLTVDLDSQHAAKEAQISLPRGGVIAGVVIDSFGDAVPQARVVAFSAQYSRGRRYLTSPGLVSTTDDQGEYRLYGLSPGTYYVTASLNSYYSSIGTDHRRNVSTFYPSTLYSFDALQVSLGLSDTITSIDITLASAGAATVRGEVNWSQSKKLMNGVVALINESEPILLTSGLQAPISNDGTFRIVSVPPGRYVIEAVVTLDRGDIETALSSIDVDSNDIDGFTLVARAPSIVRGRLTTGSTSAPALQTLPEVQAISIDSGTLSAGVRTARVHPDFSFSLSLAPGRYVFRMARSSGRWALKSVKARGRDITDSAVDVGDDQSLTDVEMEITDASTELSGEVRDLLGNVVPGARVVVFSQNRRRWAWMSRYIETASADAYGRFRVFGLPAGDYYAAAVHTSQSDVTDPDLLDRLRATALRLLLSEAHVERIVLRLGS